MRRSFLLNALLLLFIGCSTPSFSYEEAKEKAKKVVTDIFEAALNSEGGKLDKVADYKFEQNDSGYTIGVRVLGLNGQNIEYMVDSVEISLNREFRVMAAHHLTTNDK